MDKLIVKIPQSETKEYPILIGKGLALFSNKYITDYCRNKKFLIVTNETIFKLWGNKIDIKNSDWCILPDGEEYKNFDSLKIIIDNALAIKLERKDAIVAFGGGVIGDMAGFAASIYLRGIDFIQIPTTLLAQVDSSVGGKVAINHELGKNLIGSFYQPKLVLIDTDFLNTINLKQFKTGLAEVVKYGFIEKTCNYEESYDFIDFLTKNKQKIFELDKDILIQLISICCSLKNAVVTKDEKEQGLRAILNFGHTFAHAIEIATNYTEYTHGEAVAIGMKIAFALSHRMKLISNTYYESSLNLLKSFGLEYRLNPQLSVDTIVEAMYLDKKVEDGGVRFILPVGQGKVKIFENINEKLIREVVLQELLA